MVSDSKDNESQLSTDRETIEGWAGEHDAVPVRHAATESETERLRIVPTEQRTPDHEEITWEEFHEGLGRDDRIVVYHGSRRDEPFEVLERNEAVQRTTIEDQDVEEALLEGEVVTTEVTETTVVERTIVEEAEIESQVIDRETIEETVVDAELLTREVVGCEVTDLGPEPSADAFDVAQLETGHRSDDRIEVAADVDEGWMVTKEVTERLTVESRVTETDVQETDTVEDTTVESSVDVEGVQRTILESDLIDTDTATTEIIESGSIESEFGEGDVIHTQLFERKTVEEEVSLERRYAGDIGGGETTASSTINRSVIESEIVGGEEIEFEIETVVDTETAVETELESHGETDVEAASTAEETAGTQEQTHDMGDADRADSTTPSERDEGKDVVDASGEKIGIVAEVDGNTLYVDPHPSITDRIKAELNIGEMDEDAYPVSADRIVRITDDLVELDISEPTDEAD